ncbi:hypothetical protein PoB_000982600 [Plakobranchus ocellatus]|uniref:Uncharacterized protein n=1 Tax=Plakobranchus ocellatus TaxID=259542 RepID=A0AAV3YLP5_9GAST|nr:hypothetical protein PoB_000982600 [Plakobranchus ocellatus]
MNGDQPRETTPLTNRTRGASLAPRAYRQSESKQKNVWDGVAGNERKSLSVTAQDEQGAGPTTTVEPIPMSEQNRIEKRVEKS